MGSDSLSNLTISAMLVALPIATIFAALGKWGIRVAIALVAVTGLTNIVLANYVSEFGELGLMLTAALAVAAATLIWIGWKIGEGFRERRASPGKRHGMIGE
ncbi:MAG: hypothetical protein ABIQ43_04790 [Sphingomonas sp.]